MRPDPALGVFDTLLVRLGVPVDLDAHMDRLCRSVAELYDVPVDVAGLGARLGADVAGMRTARVRTTYDPTDGRWEIHATPVEEPGLDPRVVTVCCVPGGLGPHKWVDRSPIEAFGDPRELLLVDEYDLLLEAGSANVFVVLDGVVLTPPVDGRILPGTVRTRVVERLGAHGRRVEERAPTIPDLVASQEVFTTSSVRGVQPVVGCTGLGSWPAGPVTAWLRQIPEM